MMKEQPNERATWPVIAALPPLSATCRRVLSYAATMGMEFDFSILHAATGMDEEELAEVLEEMVHKGVLKEFPGGDTYCFVRQTFMVEAYLGVSSSRLRIIHRKIAEAYEKLFPDPPPQVVPDMGRHFNLGGVHAKSVLYNRYAASLATRSYSPDVAVRCLQRVMEDLPSLPGDHRKDEADVLREIGDSYRTMGESPKAEESYGKSLDASPPEETTLRALVLLSRADVLRDMDKLEASKKYCTEAIPYLQKLGHKKGLAAAHIVLSGIAFKMGDLVHGRHESETALNLLDPELDAKDIARCYVDLANAYACIDETGYQAQSIYFYKKAVKTLEPLNAYRELTRAHMNMAVALGTGKPREALDHLEQARVYAEKIRDRRMIGWTYFNGVEYWLVLGDIDQAAQDNEEARRLLSDLNDNIAMEQIALNQGLLEQKRRAYREAEDGYMEALRLAEGLGYKNHMAEMHLRLAVLYAEWDRREDALSEFSRLEAIGADKLVSQNKPDYEALRKRLGFA
jgi:tetratricopeptide (TPR) repeat protein